MRNIPALNKSLNDFETDVLTGLSSELKYIPSKYFYDGEGDKLFQQIMKLEEYYPTHCETEILTKNKEKLLELFYKNEQSFDLIELGAGDGEKTKILLEYFSAQKTGFKYFPVDISEHIINILVDDIRIELDILQVEGIVGDYFEALKRFTPDPSRRKVVLFLGASVGNFTERETILFFTEVAKHLSVHDLFIVGFDLKKDPDIILNAYNDVQGITRAFNLNVLTRINNELNANFDLDSFFHFPNYCPVTGDAKSYLVSKTNQEVSFRDLNITIPFHAWEPIFTEVSKKYNEHGIKKIAHESGFIIEAKFMDSKKYFGDYVFRKLL